MSLTNTENTESETSKNQSDDVGGKPLLLKFGRPTKLAISLLVVRPNLSTLIDWRKILVSGYIFEFGPIDFANWADSF